MGIITEFYFGKIEIPKMNGGDRCIKTFLRSTPLNCTSKVWTLLHAFVTHTANAYSHSFSCWKNSIFFLLSAF